MRGAAFVIGVLGVVGFASVAWGVPVVVDGNVGGTEYFAYLDDAIGEAIFDSPSWDIARVGVDADNNWLYMGLDPVGVFDPDGGPSSFFDRTLFFGFFVESIMTTYQFEMLFSTGPTVMKLNGVPLTPGVDFVEAHANDMEVKLARSLVPGLVDSDADGKIDFFLRAQLDDVGFGNDDQVQGEVQFPEPGTVGLLAVGALVLTIRRRRR